jgi:hypothetical protein
VKEGILGFVVGCALTGAALGIYAHGLKTELRVSQKEAQIQQSQAKAQQTDEQHQVQGKLQEEQAAQAQLQEAQTKLQAQLQESQSQLQGKQSMLQVITQQRDECQGKFGRGTFLYEAAILGGPTRLWFIPADVQPVYFGTRSGTFSHYDLKTQVETVQFQARKK